MNMVTKFFLTHISQVFLDYDRKLSLAKPPSMITFHFVIHFTNLTVTKTT